jgi:hypothetical protein
LQYKECNLKLNKTKIILSSTLSHIPEGEASVPEASQLEDSMKGMFLVGQAM